MNRKVKGETEICSVYHLVLSERRPWLVKYFMYDLSARVNVRRFFTHIVFCTLHWSTVVFHGWKITLYPIPLTSFDWRIVFIEKSPTRRVIFKNVKNTVNVKNKLIIKIKQTLKSLSATSLVYIRLHRKRSKRYVLRTSCCYDLFTTCVQRSLLSA